MADLLIAESGRRSTPMRLSAEKESLFHEMLHLVRPIEPVVEVVREHRGKLPLAVATGAVRSVCEKILVQIGLSETFDTIVSSEDVERHKPAPDVFLEAARRLGVDPRDCRVYEDTDPGIEAARAPAWSTSTCATFTNRAESLRKSTQENSMVDFSAKLASGLTYDEFLADTRHRRAPPPLGRFP